MDHTFGCSVPATGNLQNTKLSECGLLPHKVNIQLNVLREPVMDRVARHVDAGDVVAVGHRCLGDAAVELTEQMPELHSATALAIPRYSASALEQDTAV